MRSKSSQHNKRKTMAARMQLQRRRRLKHNVRLRKLRWPREQSRNARKKRGARLRRSESKSRQKRRSCSELSRPDFKRKR